MKVYVKKLEIKGIFGLFDYEINLNEGINVFYGKNGTGKTTILHILANVLNADFNRFVYINFDSIDLILSDDTEIVVEKDDTDTDKINIFVNTNAENFSTEINTDLQKSKIVISRKDVSIRDERLRHITDDELLRLSDERILKYLDIKTDIILPTAYFPSFRTMVDAWSAQRLGTRLVRYRNRKDVLSLYMTSFARRLFGEFVPLINYPSIIQIENELSDDINEASLALANKDRELLSRAFLNILPAISKENLSKKQVDISSKDVLLSDIKNILKDLENISIDYTSGYEITSIYNELYEMIDQLSTNNEYTWSMNTVLGIYKNLLETRIDFQKEKFSPIENYLNAVNHFLENKRIEILRDYDSPHSIGVHFENNINTSLKALSSGERQILTLIYAATRLKKQEVVLIDEPEISLHVDWQRSLLNNMANQLNVSQVIVCTHSPVIGLDHEDHLQELVLSKTEKRLK